MCLENMNLISEVFTQVSGHITVFLNAEKRQMPQLFFSFICQ